MRLRTLLVLVTVMVVLVALGVTQALAAKKHDPQNQPTEQPAAGSMKVDTTSDSTVSPNAITYAQVMDAVVDSSGNLKRGDATGATRDPNTAGFYEVDFPRNVSNCAYVATIGDPSTGVATPGQISVATRLGNAKGVFVSTQDSNGSQSNRGFHLQVSC